MNDFDIYVIWVGVTFIIAGSAYILISFRMLLPKGENDE